MGQTKKLRGHLKSPYAYYLMLPALLVYALLFVLPALSGLLLSFFNVKSFKLSTITFAGLENYATVLRNPYFSIAIKNTLLFAVVTTLGKVIFGMALALLVNQRFHGVNYMRTVFFLPAVLNNVAVGLVFRSMMHPSGLINQTLSAMGLDMLMHNWLTDAKIAIFSCAFVEIWKWTGYTMVIFLAGLQSIDKTYYEAAGIDGATIWQQIRYITLPLMKTVIIMMFIMAVGRIFYSDFGLFYQVPRDSNTLYNYVYTLDVYVYKQLKTSTTGMASAAAFVQSVAGCITILTANAIVRKIDRESAMI